MVSKWFVVEGIPRDVPWGYPVAYPTGIPGVLAKTTMSTKPHVRSAYPIRLWEKAGTPQLSQQAPNQDPKNMSQKKTPKTVPQTTPWRVP